MIKRATSVSTTRTRNQQSHRKKQNSIAQTNVAKRDCGVNFLYDSKELNLTNDRVRCHMHCKLSTCVNETLKHSSRFQLSIRFIFECLLSHFHIIFSLIYFFLNFTSVQPKVKWNGLWFGENLSTLSFKSLYFDSIIFKNDFFIAKLISRCLFRRRIWRHFFCLSAFSGAFCQICWSASSVVVFFYSAIVSSRHQRRPIFSEVLTDPLS